jgi:hypothetical protein
MTAVVILDQPATSPRGNNDIQRRKQLELLKFEGSVDFFEDYDPKQLRSAR